MIVFAVRSYRFIKGNVTVYAKGYKGCVTTIRKNATNYNCYKANKVGYKLKKLGYESVEKI